MAINPYQPSGVEVQTTARRPVAHSLSYRTEMRRGFWFGATVMLILLLPVWLVGVGKMMFLVCDFARRGTLQEVMKLALYYAGMLFEGTSVLVALAALGGGIGASVMALATRVRRPRTS